MTESTTSIFLQSRSQIQTAVETIKAFNNQLAELNSRFAELQLQGEELLKQIPELTAVIDEVDLTERDLLKLAVSTLKKRQ